MIVYNLISWLRSIYTDITIYMNITRLSNEKLPERYVVVNESGGEDGAAIESYTYQFKFHDIDANRCKILAEEFYYTMINKDEWGARFNLTLPKVNVKSVVYPAVKLHSIIAIQKPYCIGIDENSRVLYVFNIIIRLGGQR